MAKTDDEVRLAKSNRDKAGKRLSARKGKSLHLKSHKYHGITDEHLLKVLKECLGIRSEAANKLGITHGAITHRIKRSEHLIQGEAEINESCIDFSESQLLKLVKEGYFPAIKYHLDAKGRSRGYGRPLVSNINIANTNAVNVDTGNIIPAETLDQISDLILSDDDVVRIDNE